MAATETLTSKIDHLLALFNARKMDLPDGLFDRKTQFVLNGAPFETLLGQPPADPLVLMLTRGPAGYRFITKSLQHAVPDGTVERGDVTTTGDPFSASLKLWLSGHLRGTGESIETMVDITLHFAPAGPVDVAHATVDAAPLDRLREGRLRP
jgi:hypothetical protein